MEKTIGIHWFFGLSVKQNGKDGNVFETVISNNERFNISYKIYN